MKEEKKKIKVMHLIWSMGDGGAQQVVINYLRDLKDDEDIDIHVFVYTAPTESKFDQEILDNDYPVTYLNNPKSRINIPVLRYPFNKAVARRTWYQAIRDYNPDIVHVHISGLLDDVLMPIVKANVPIRFDTLHSNPLRYTGHQLRVIKKAFNRYGFIPVCVTKEQANIAKSHYGITNYELVRNGIDIEALKAKIVPKTVARERLGISEDSFVVLGLGRLDKVKNFELLISAFEKIVRTNDNAILLLAGAGPEKERLQKLTQELNVSDKVRFLGYVKETNILYSASDVIGVTSHSESASLVLIESQVFGLRAVISAGVPDESIVSNQVIKMSRNASVDEWAKGLLETEDVGKNVNNIEDYDVHEISKHLKNIYLRNWRNVENKELDKR